MAQVQRQNKNIAEISDLTNRTWVEIWSKIVHGVQVQVSGVLQIYLPPNFMKNLLLKCSILTFQWLCDCPCPSSGKPSRSELPVVAPTCLNQRSVPVWQLLTYPPKRLPYLLKDCLHPNWDNSNHPYKVVLKNMNKNLCDNRSRKTRIREDQSTFPKFVQFQHYQITYQSLYNMIRWPVEFNCKKKRPEIL